MRSRGRSRTIAGVSVAVIAIVGLLAVYNDLNKPDGVAAPLRNALHAATPAAVPFEGWTEAKVAVGGRCLRVIVADSLPERETGLMNRSDLGGYDGMLFVSPVDSGGKFWMVGTVTPLDIRWFDRNGSPVGDAQMVPCTTPDEKKCTQYGARKKWRFALETLHGHSPTGALSAC